MAEKETLSLEEAAAALKVGLPTIEALVARGALAAHSEGGERCVRYADLLAFMRDSHRASMDDGEAPAGQLDVGMI